MTVDWDKAAKAASENIQRIINRAIDKEVLMDNPISADNDQALRLKQAYNNKVTELYHAKDERDEWRTKAKTLGKQLGKAGDTIHRLRGDLALLRSKDWNMVGDMYLKQRRENDEIRAELKRLVSENAQLHYQLRQVKVDEFIEGY